MSIDSQFEKTYKDMSGSVAKNRLTIQISYAIKLIVDLFSVEDYTVFLDCIEDIAVKTVNAGNEKIFLYQVKSKKHGEFTLTYIINEKWFEKLYKHTKEFSGLNYEIALVSNVDIEDKQIIFPNERSNLVTDIIEKESEERKRRLYRIKKAISKKEKILINEVDLSKFYIIKTNLHCDTHKDQAQKILSDFIADIDSTAEWIKVKAFFTTLYDTLDSRFNDEINPNNSNFEEIVRRKGYTKKEFQQALQAYMNESIPKNTELFTLLGITSIKEQREIAQNRASFLMDLTNKDEAFKIFISEIIEFVAQCSTSTLLQDSVDFVLRNNKISQIYKIEGYVKFATAFFYYKYINGRV